jgi:hypothetical protein
MIGKGASPYPPLTFKAALCSCFEKKLRGFGRPVHVMVVFILLSLIWFEVKMTNGNLFS